MNFKTLKSICLMSLALLATGCIDENDTIDQFEINMTGYVLQEGDGDNKKFTPFFYVTPNYTDFELSEVKITKENGECGMKFVRNSEYLYVLDGEYSVSSIADLSGVYYVSAITKNNDSAVLKQELKYTAADTVPAIEVENFEYNGSYMKAKVKQIKDAYCIGFTLSPYNKDGKPSRYVTSFFPFYTSQVYFNSGIADIQQAIYTTNSSFNVDYAQVKVFAVNNAGVQRESEPKTLARDQKCFIEDNK